MVFRPFVLIAFISVLHAPTALFADVRLEILSSENWDELAPQGKEVDAIYGDYVFRNQHIVAVVANPTQGRSANMTVGNVGGAVIDLTDCRRPNDQLSAFYPGGGAYKFTDPKQVKVRRTPSQVSLTIKAVSPQGGPQIEVRYTLGSEDRSLRIENIVANTSAAVMETSFRDMMRADGPFQFGTSTADSVFWAHDEWFHQAYGIYSGDATLSHVGTRGVVISYAWNKQATIRLAPGQLKRVTRRLFPGRHRLDVIGQGEELAGRPVSQMKLEVLDSNGPVRNAQVTWATRENKVLGLARTDRDGQVEFLSTPGEFVASVAAVGRPKQEFALTALDDAAVNVFQLQVQPCGYVQAVITSENGEEIPCKVSFAGKAGSTSPHYGPNSGDYEVHNCIYSEDGTFKAELGPGQYDVIISRGPEYDAIFTELRIQPNATTHLRGSLVRTVSTPGWVSADFHSHSSPSGDNTGSQLGRVLNLLAEQIEFAPCTEHNRVSSYAQHVNILRASKWIATCPGMELTGVVLPVNHQNAFPMIHRPRTQDGGGPRILSNPVEQIKRLAMWDDNSDKLVQENHPNLARILGDQDEDGETDAGFHGMIPFMDAIEIHPPATILLEPGTEKFKETTRNPVFTWLQMLNLGYRITGVVNTDAHYNFHGSGWIRNYVRSSSDSPSEIKTMEMVHHSEQGHVVMTTGPYLEFAASSGDQVVGPGDDLTAANGSVNATIRVQCPNWIDINRVQILVNGRLDDRYNFTRRQHPDMFHDGVVKFDESINIELANDAHLIVVAAGEGLQLGPVMGADRGQQTPIAVSNPVYVDRDGGGFKANGDRLGVPLHIAASVPTASVPTIVPATIVPATIAP
jgi:hypothetical protein